MARKRSLEKLLEGISGLVDTSRHCATVFVTDFKSGHVTLAQFGSEKRPPLSPVADVIRCSQGKSIIGAILDMFDNEELDDIRDLIDEIQESREDEDEWEYETATEPCCKCVHFENKGCNFGTCPKIENAFDGEEANSKIIGNDRGCKYFNYKHKK